MAEASSVFSASPPDEEEFYCPICREVFKTPVRTVACKHVFCRKCFLTAVRTSGSHCPMCRGHISRTERCLPTRATDVENDMRTFSGNCKCCGKQVKLSRMRLHYQYCSKYQEEYGGRPRSPEPPFFFPYLTVNGYNPHTFQCPVCQEDCYGRRNLLEHCNRRHSTQIVAKVCPICASVPWGDGTHVFNNVVGHLNARHGFDYGGFARLSPEEEAVLMESYEMNF